MKTTTVVTLTVEVRSPTTWQDNYSLEHVYKCAGEEAAQILRREIKQGVISELKVLSVRTESRP